ncbi:enoyl-CoA hydratase/isomerase family protein [Nocardia sp. NBC_01327]|uniref:enoyl-CoA hydratase/isomerase family protein n=1 Tax=Nocardia sp. NBC_01327 TaxID=2903593 RepID=UPI002E10AA57|nr:enoyl-CoA hydratase/isomerase family protein [Nocardia sp. NBC_01327]
MSEDAPTASPAVSVEHPVPGVALVTLNRPRSLNAISEAFAAEMAVAFTQLATEAAVSVVILTGAGRGFSSGADLSAMATGIGAEGTELRLDPMIEWMRRAARPYVALTSLPQLTIAAVNGPAAGAGWGLAMGCDIRIAGPSASFCATFVRMGLGPDYGLSRTLPDTVGEARALELLATGRTVDSAEALRIGLVSAVADDAVAAAVDLAESVTAAPDYAIRSLKRTVRRSSNADAITVINEIEATAQAELFAHPRFHASAADWLSRFKSTGVTA